MIENFSFEKLGDWIRNELPRLNKDEDTGAYLAIELSAEKQFSAASLAIRAFTQEEARRAIQLLSFPVSSLEKKKQTLGSPPGLALAGISKGVKTLTDLSQIGRHPPRDTLYTYCLWNKPENRLTFSDDPQEHLFIDVVSGAVQSMDRCLEIIRTSIQNKEINAEALRGAVSEIKTVFAHYARFHGKTPSDSPAFSKEFFRDTLRQFNCPWTLDGQLWTGPTAANSSAFMGLDLRLDNACDAHKEHIRSRLRYMTEEDQWDLIADETGASIADVFTAKLGINKKDFLNLSEAEIHKKITENKLSTEAEALVQFYFEYSRLSNVHMGLIHKFLLRNSAGEAANLPVANDRGTSGMNIEQVEEIKRARKEGAFYQKLSQSLLTSQP